MIRGEGEEGFRRMGLSALLGLLVVGGAALLASAQPVSDLDRDREASEDWITVPVNVFIVGGTPSPLARDPSFAAPGAWLGTPSGLARQLVALALERVNRTWAVCSLRFEQNVLAVVAAQRLALPSGRTLLQERKEFASYYRALPLLANRALPSGERVYRAINLFVVDALVDVLGLGALPSARRDARISLVAWRSLGRIPTRTIAHEFGHNLGLFHSDLSGNLMVSGGRGRALTPEQCRRARLFARDLNWSMRPQILDLTFPGRVPVGSEFAVSVVFRDPDRDVAFAILSRVEMQPSPGVLKPVARVFTPDVKGRISGTFRLTARCSQEGRVVWEVLVVDELGKNTAKTVSVECTARGEAR